MKRLFIFLLIPSFIGAADLADALAKLRPNAKWALTGNTYDGLVWLDTETAKPTRVELAKAYQDYLDAQAVRRSEMAQARIDVKNSSLTTEERVHALIMLLNYDQ